MLREQKVVLGGHSVFTRGKGWRPEGKGNEWDEREDAWRSGAKDKMGRDEKANEEKVKPPEKEKETKEVKEK